MLLILSYVESSDFSNKSESLIYKGNITERGRDIVDQGNRLERITSVTANAGDDESSARKIAKTTDMEGEKHPGSSHQLSSVREYLSDNE